MIPRPDDLAVGTILVGGRIRPAARCSVGIVRPAGVGRQVETVAVGIVDVGLRGRE